MRQVGLGSWCMALALLAGAFPARATEPLMPTGNLQRYLDSERRAGAEASPVLAEALVREARHGTRAARLDLLALAARLDPTRADVHLQRCGLLLLDHKPVDASVALVDAGRAAWSDPVARARVQLQALQLARRAAVILLAALLLLLGMRTLPLASHLLRDHAHAPVLALLLVAGPLLGVGLAFPALGLLLAAAALLPWLEAPVRRRLAVLLLVLAGTEVALARLHTETVLADPTSRTARLHRLAWSRALPDSARHLEAEVGGHPLGELVLGLQARRAGDTMGAARHGRAALAADSSLAAAYVNLANLWFAAGDLERAAAGYRAAQTWAPDDPIPHANLAQVYIRMVAYEEADAELRAAAARGLDAVLEARRIWQPETRPVLDMLPPADRLVAFAAAEAALDPARQGLRRDRWRGMTLWYGLPPRAALVLLALLAVALLLRGLVAPGTFVCRTCGRITCRTCSPALPERGVFCERCHAEASQEVSQPYGMPARRPSPVAAPPARTEGPAWLVPWFPGGAELVLGDAPAAFRAAIGASAGIALWGVALSATALDRASILDVLRHPAAQTGSVVYLMAYLPGLLRLRARRRSGRATETVARPRPRGGRP